MPVEGGIPHIPGIEMFGNSIPAGTVGGDLFEYINFQQRYDVDSRIQLATFWRKSRFSGLVWYSRKGQKCGQSVQGEEDDLLGEGATDIDQVVSNHAEADPSFHSSVSFVTASTQSVPAFEYADSSFATGSPLLSFAEPALLLISAAFRALGGTIGNGKALYPHALNLRFSLRGVEAGIAGDHGGNPVKALLVYFH